MLTYTVQNIVPSLNECFIPALVELQTPEFVEVWLSNSNSKDVMQVFRFV